VTREYGIGCEGKLRKMKFGVFLDVFDQLLTYSDLRDLAIESERLGYESVWICDHLMSEGRPILECLTTLSALSSLTRNIRLGSLVLCNSYRNPSVLAKVAATLDVISNGRLEFGIGAGWAENEYLAYGIPFSKPSIRIAQMREGIEIIKRMWTEERVSYEGKYFRLEDAICEPKPLQKPHPPITIGGSGEKLLLKVVAEYADRYNWWCETVGTCKHKLKVLEKHCSAIGRDYREIEKSVDAVVNICENKQELREILKKLFSSEKRSISFKEWLKMIKVQNIVGTPSECLERIKEYADLGITYFMLKFQDLPSKRGIRLFSEEVFKRI
jgi:F420-dependent oxidoreductase-like protein